MTTGIRHLDELLALRDLRREALVERLGPATSDGEERYQNLRSVTRLELAGAPDLSFYLSGDQVALVYSPAGEHLPELSEARLEEALGPPPLTLRSRAGKRSRLLVYPEHGLALSTSDAAEFVEVFQPCSAEAYQREIYREPGAFIR